MLVTNGKRNEVSTRMSEQPHPRSAVGWNERFLYFATVDGRQREISLGLRLSEMADFMVDLGCREVINMDGGQSTTLILNGEIINHPAPMRGQSQHDPRFAGSRHRQCHRGAEKSRENDSDDVTGPPS
jgi:exopolysaccharide biosynthesis protein